MAATSQAWGLTVSRLRIAVATLIAVVWAYVIYRAANNPELTGLATVVTPVMLAPVGWLFMGERLRKQFDRKEPDEH